jgi:putative Ig domain-containing protein
MARALGAVAVLAAGALAVVLLSGGPAERAAAQNAAGWKCLPTFGRCDESGAANKTVKAAVGQQFEWRAAAVCATGPWGVGWLDVQSGSLPPGLFIEPSVWAIFGVPTQAGSYSFQIVFHGISCPGSNPPSGDHTASFTIVVTG